MAGSFVNGTAVNVTNVTAIPVVIPTGVQVGDLIVVCIGKATTTGSYSALTGWNQVLNTENPTFSEACVYWRFASASEVAGQTVTFTSTASTSHRLTLEAFRGVDAASALAGSIAGIEAGGSSTSHPLDASSVSPAGNAIAVWMMFVTSNAGTFSASAPTGYTEGAESANASSTIGAHASYKMVSAGSLGTITGTTGGTSRAIMFALAFNVAADQTVSPSGIGSAEAEGSPTVTVGPVTVSPSGIAPGTVGVPTVTAAGQIGPSSIASSEAFGTPTVTPGATTISPGGVATGAVFGSPTVFAGQAIVPGGIASSGAFGSPTVTTTVTVSPSAIDSGEAFGDATVSLPGDPQSVTDTGAIGSAETFGSPSLSQTATHEIVPIGISAGTVFGVARVRLATEIAASPELDVLTDPTTSERYVFPVSHGSEDAVTERRSLSYGAPAAGVTVVRQQGPGGDMVLRLNGTILEQAQYDALVDFNVLCEDRTLVYSDFAGDEYEVLVTSFDARPVRAARNPREPGLLYAWTYTLELHVIEVRAGAYA